MKIIRRLYVTIIMLLLWVCILLIPVEWVLRLLFIPLIYIFGGSKCAMSNTRKLQYIEETTMSRMGEGSLWDYTYNFKKKYEL